MNITDVYVGSDGLLLYKYIFDFFGIPFNWGNVNLMVVFSFIVLFVLLVVGYYFKVGVFRYDL